MRMTYVRITLEESFVVRDKFMWNYEWKNYMKKPMEEKFGKLAGSGMIAVFPRKIPIILPRCMDFITSGNRLIVPKNSILEFRIRTTINANETDILKELNKGQTKGFYDNGLGLFRYAVIKQKEILHPDDLYRFRLMDAFKLKELMDGRQEQFEIEGSEASRQELWLMEPEQILAITGDKDIPKGIQKILNAKA